MSQKTNVKTFNMQPETHRPRLLVGIAAVIVFLLPSLVDAQSIANRDAELESDAREFADALLREFRYPDLARKWLNARLAKSSSKDARADYEWWIADCLKLEGKLDEYSDVVQDLARRYPSHRMSRFSQLTVQQANLAKVLTASDDLRKAKDEDQRKEIQKQRDALFKEIDDICDKQVKAIRAMTKEPARTDLVWWQFAIHAHRLYGERLGEDEAKLRKTALTKARDLAQGFVEEFFGLAFDLACEAQLARAQILDALGEAEEAADTFDTLIEITPPSLPPYPVDVQRFILSLRLRSITGTALAWNHKGKPEKSVESFGFFNYNDPDFSLKHFENDSGIQEQLLRAKIEEAVSNLAGGDYAYGRGILSGLLDKYADPKLPAKVREANDGWVQEINQGLSRAVELDFGGQDPELYYRAGVGFKARYMFDDAATAFRNAIAMSSRSTEKADRDWLGISLFELGEACFILDRREEAGCAFLMLLENFSQGQLDRLPKRGVGQKASQNAFAIFDKLYEEYGGAAWQDEARVAEKFFEREGTGNIVELLKLKAAFDLEEKQRYSNAREKYLSIMKEVTTDDGNKVKISFYYDSRASAARCLFLEKSANGDPKAARDEAAAELAKADAEAKADGNEAGRASIRYQWAQFFWPQDEKTLRDAKQALEVLGAFGSEINVKTEHREGGLFLWIKVLLAEDKLAEAEKVFSKLQRDFGRGGFALSAVADLIEAHQNAGTREDLIRAGELADIYLDHPNTDVDNLQLGGLLWLALALIDGAHPDKAIPVLEQANQKMLSESDPEPEVVITVKYFLGKAANKTDPEKAYSDLKSLLKDYEQDLRHGTYDICPQVMWELAKACVNVHAKSPSKKMLDEAIDYIGSAIYVYHQRRASLQSMEVPKQLERSYWATELFRLKVLVAKNQREAARKAIRTFRIAKGTDKNGDPIPYAPADLQKEFDEIYN